ncbi:hypothetical protein [Buchnera aphidicola]|uniref:hypothetical protein n=1 Tax=Buchnera aphidicola TaxID=9 RepID=UPI00031DE108|nr:hypothetical protein [Buchnera aphidicola]
MLGLTHNYSLFVIIKEDIISGGARSGVNEFFMKQKINVFVLNIRILDKFVS